MFYQNAILKFDGAMWILQNHGFLEVEPHFKMQSLSRNSESWFALHL